MRYIVIKCGGSVLDELTSSFFTSLSELEKRGFKLVFVHGGGPDINEMLELFQVTPQFVNGLRKTDEQTLKIAEMILAGQTNRKLVSLLQQHHFPAVGISGSDGCCLQAEYLNREKLGFVGKISEVHTKFLELVVNENYIPVITPIGITENGDKLNINADYVAAEVAKALNAEKCLFVTNVDGVFIEDSLAESLSHQEVNTYIAKGEISGGMIPKVRSALTAVEKGVESVMIVSGKKTFFENDHWHGTRFYQKETIKH
ncbi:acetylglutamate kinase [Bacillus sp. BRMEA1]|uniref:acetylglutamate kinase n=1 Tax=Neobacillus endophyticus TaxID=2738405 RepID=UPI0015634E8F|nr:acetylglutamate kinase [Neobacillus endophyticus]NRD77832.1 acetylglutamate kinase [Neobacillus endophyticus]